ncbi:hypothetical protein BDR26DRAFT_339088 [Obelidium mucronatum]|nr:hypothetical protein BDR26DRAFT_339088 [Obelidium mucronatum]
MAGNVTASHPIGCSNPVLDESKYGVKIKNSLSLSLVFNYVDSACNDNLLGGPGAAAGMPQVIGGGASQTVMMFPGSVIVALEAINNGQSTGHVVAAFRSGVGNSTWEIASDLNAAGGGANTGAIVGGVVGGLVAVAALAAAAVFWRRRRASSAPWSKPAPPVAPSGAAASLAKPAPAAAVAGLQATPNSLHRPLPNRAGAASLPRRPSAGAPTVNATNNNNNNNNNNNSLGRPVPTRNNTATPNSDSLGRRPTNNNNANNTNNNSLERPLPGSKLAAGVATVPAASNSLSRTPSNKVVTPKIDDESNYYSSEPADPTAPGSRLRLKHPHTPAMDDELRLNKGDIVEMIEVFEDGWCHAKVVMSGLRGVTRRGDEGMLPVGCLEIVQPAGQQKVLKNVKTPTAAKAQYAGNWDEYTRQKKRTSSLYSTGAY